MGHDDIKKNGIELECPKSKALSFQSIEMDGV